MHVVNSICKYKNILLIKFILRTTSSKGFALPQILILAIGITITLVGLMNASINRVSTSRLSIKEMQAKNATESAFNSVRALLNNSRSGAYYYYWLLKSCSSTIPNSKVNIECPTFGGGRSGSQWPGQPILGMFRDPSRIYWSDTNNEWCVGNGISTCKGRPVAPSCFYLGRRGKSGAIDWDFSSNAVSQLINGTEKTIDSSKNSLNIQSFDVKSTDFVGDEEGGENSIVLAGFNSSPSNVKSGINATNKIRANVQVYRIIPDSGFAFLSAGENFDDSNSLFLGNFNMKNQDQAGSIIWRKNINPLRDYVECPNIKRQSGIKDFTKLPDESRNKGGLWVQPLKMPPRPKVSNQGSLGSLFYPGNTIVCLKDGNTKWFNSNCTFLETSGYTNYRNKDRVYTIDNLVVRGKDAYFGVVTSDQSKVTLIFTGSVDLSNGGRICHRNESIGATCGSGKPENLTILFNQLSKNNISKQRLFCSSNGGMSYKKDPNRGIPSTHPNNIPFNTLNVSATGNNNEYFSAFVYAPDTTFSTATPQTEYYSRAVGPSQLISTIKGVYALIDKPNGSSFQRAPKLIRNIYGDLVPYTINPDKDSWDRRRFGFDDTYIIAAGRKGYSPRPEINNLMDQMFLIWDSVTKDYFLVGYQVVGNEVRFVDRNINGKLWVKKLGPDPYVKDSRGDYIIHHFGMELRRVANLPKDKYFKGSAWVKNACFDNSGRIIWDFNNEYPTKLVKRYNNSKYNFGVPFYRGKTIEAWDTLRSFN